MGKIFESNLVFKLFVAFYMNIIKGNEIYALKFRTEVLEKEASILRKQNNELVAEMAKMKTKHRDEVDALVGRIADMEKDFIDLEDVQDMVPVKRRRFGVKPVPHVCVQMLIPRKLNRPIAKFRSRCVFGEDCITHS